MLYKLEIICSQSFYQALTLVNYWEISAYLLVTEDFAPNLHLSCLLLKYLKLLSDVWIGLAIEFYCLFELRQFESHSVSYSFGLMLLGATSRVSMPLFFVFPNELLASGLDASV